MAATNTNGTSPYYAHMVGWGMAVPETVMTNHDMAAIVETDDEWIVARTGIRERRIASERESTATLGLKAAQVALERADMLPIELDLIICATSTPENVFPSSASLIQDWLGANKAGAFDLSAACSGFVYAVQMAAQSIRSGAINRALVIGAETMSRILDWQDRSTCILFGDGAGAVVLERSTVPGGVLSGVLRSDGSGGDLLGIPSVGSIDVTLAQILVDGHKPFKMHMAGGEVFKFATRVIADSVKQAVDQAGIGLRDLKAIIPHQANMRIIDAGARALGVDKSLFVCNLDRYGNTSAASIPIALAEAVQAGRILPGDYIAMVGFGGGLTWAAMVVQWTERQARTPFGGPRRQFSYTVSSARSTLRRISKRYGDLLNRVRPERGRMQRLKRRIDSSDEFK